MRNSSNVDARNNLGKSIILASSSPRRAQLLASVGIQASVIPSDADERVDPQWQPGDIVVQLALRKAGAVAEQQRNAGQAAVVIGADTIVVLDGEVLGKPDDAAHATEMLAKLQGRTHEVYTGVCVIDALSGEVVSDDVRSVVTFNPMSEREILAYVNTGEPLDKAGSYGVQGIGALFVARIEGDFFSVMGLPLHVLYPMLLRFGISPFVSDGQSLRHDLRI